MTYSGPREQRGMGMRGSTGKETERKRSRKDV